MSNAECVYIHNQIVFTMNSKHWQINIMIIFITYTVSPWPSLPPSPHPQEKTSPFADKAR